MRIVLASSEAVPFSKSGGLADVTTALAKALGKAGHKVWLLVPHYPQAQSRQGAGAVAVQPTGQRVQVRLGSKVATGEVLRAQLPGSHVTVLLVDRPEYFDRNGLYQEDGRDYKDNCERFVFFSRAVLETARQMDLRPDVVHANDWQTGLIPALLALEDRLGP